MAVFGLGYVGAVSALCMARDGAAAPGRTIVDLVDSTVAGSETPVPQGTVGALRTSTLS